jgi:hypothetical protein
MDLRVGSPPSHLPLAFKLASLGRLAAGLLASILLSTLAGPAFL